MAIATENAIPATSISEHHNNLEILNHQYPIAMNQTKPLITERYFCTLMQFHNYGCRISIA